MKRISWIIITCCLILINTNLSGAETKVKESAKAVEEKPSAVRRAGWAIFGERYYLPNMGYPIAKELRPYTPIPEHTIPLRLNSSKNKGADSTGWVPIPINDNKTYYRAEYHLKDLAIPLEPWIDEILRHYKNKGVPKDYSRIERSKILKKGKIQIVMFSKDDFFLRYHPGKNLLLKKNGDKNGALLPTPRSGVTVKPVYVGIPKEDVSSLVGVFNGTFHNNNAKYKSGNQYVRPGLIMESTVIDKTLRRLASIAVFKDRTFSIDETGDIPEKEIYSLRQNNFLVLDNGELDEPGAYPFGWRTADTEVLRSYLFTTQDEQFFGYIWTNFCPPAIIGQVMQKIGAQQMMLLDINPPINAIFSSPNTSGQNVPFNRKSSYFFVPNEDRVVNAVLLAIARKANGPLQQDQYEGILGSLDHDFFSVYQR